MPFEDWPGRANFGSYGFSLFSLTSSVLDHSATAPTSIKVCLLGGAVAEWSKAVLVRENKEKSKRSQVRPPTWAPLKKACLLDNDHVGL